ncbi:VOC family protein [Sinomonas halotolerans]|uniref:VOC family protein n=1 Tax=Sinomonas halotolerans TaxID=1644133 RepID=A0ABU9X0B0_9MICC
MPTPEVTPGAPIWADLMTSDIEKAKEFYTALFGWTYETGDEEKYGGYTTASKDGRAVAGLMRKMEDQGSMPDVWSVYLATEDIAATADSVTQAGGQVFMPPMEVPDQGHMAMFSDAGGAVFGGWQPAPMAGFEKVAEPGSPVWFELNARDYDASVAFYEKALGWKTDVMSDSAEMRYTTLGSGMDAKAGIFDASKDLPEGVPPHWTVYWGVEDADAAITTATSLGATVLMTAVDTPYGRMAALADPMGAAFRIMQDLGQGQPTA